MKMSGQKTKGCCGNGPLPGSWFPWQQGFSGLASSQKTYPANRTECIRGKATWKHSQHDIYIKSYMSICLYCQKQKIRICAIEQRWHLEWNVGSVRLTLCMCVYMFLCVWERGTEREKDYICVYDCVCYGSQEGENLYLWEFLCVWLCEKDSISVYVCVCVSLTQSKASVLPADLRWHTRGLLQFVTLSRDHDARLVLCASVWDSGQWADGCLCLGVSVGLFRRWVCFLIVWFTLVVHSHFM